MDIADDSDLQLLKVAQDGVPIDSQPYMVWAKKLGWSEEDVIKRLLALEREGIIRRFAATIGHRAIGILANAMIAWQVPAGDVEAAGSIFASFEEVTHCYERLTVPEWPYNIYTMVHSRSRDDCIEIALRLSEASGINEYKILFSEREYKKTSARI
jgi:DNA-binding Lrp family transcriptional regulator